MADNPIYEKDVFNCARQIAAPEDRLAYLQEACGKDQAALHRILELLRVYDQERSFLESPAAGLPLLPEGRGVGGEGVGATMDEPVSERPGVIIGPYKLLQQIGEGGMGTVFMAEQTEPVKRKVALKVIRPGMDSRQVIARFEAERQALAMMDHVNIARVFDGGTTENGRPYFVMELVHGVPITKYCDDNHLTPRERLELFVPVCQAIQHAHQKGIIHRDVKPSNVMVTLYDGKPVPKVIDFGVAKATEQKLTERTLFTQYGTMVGTLEYMSPEQAEMSALGVDTRSDIYSLGVLLYELLTGSTPLTHQRMKEAAYAEILRMIKEEEPPRPSTRLSDSGEALASISANRHTEPAKLTKLVRGELDWIVMKALEKDRNRRYETANGFALDVQRYLEDEAVQACPPSLTYRLRKFTRRNRRPIVAAALVLMALVCGIIGTIWQARVAIQERDDKQMALNQLTEEQLTTKAALAAKEQALAVEAKRRRQALDALDAATSLKLGDFKSGQELKVTEAQNAFLRKALVTYEELAEELGDDQDVRARAAAALLWVAAIRDDLHEKDAEAAFKRCLERYANMVADYPKEDLYPKLLVAIHMRLGGLAYRAGRRQDAATSFRAARALLKRPVAEFPADATLWQYLARFPGGTGTPLQENLAEVNYSLAGFCSDEERVAMLGETLGLYKKVAADFPSAYRTRRLLEIWLALGDSLHVRRRIPEAEAAYRDAITFARQGGSPISSDGEQTLTHIHGKLAGVLSAAGRYPAAEAAYRETIALQIRSSLHGNESELCRNCEALIRLVLMVRPQEAETVLRDMIAIWDSKHLAQSTILVANSFGSLLQQIRLVAHHLENVGRPEAAAAAYRDALPVFAQAAEHNRTDLRCRTMLVHAHFDLAIVLIKHGRIEEGLAAHRDGMAILKRDVVGDPVEGHLSNILPWQCTLMGAELRRSGRLHEAEKEIGEVVALFEKQAARFPENASIQQGLGNILNTLAEVLRDGGNPAQVRQLRERAIGHFRAAFRLAPRDFDTYWGRLPQCFLEMGNHRELAKIAMEISKGPLPPQGHPINPDRNWTAACWLARCVPLAQEDASLSAADRQKLTQEYGDQAMALLRESISKGNKQPTDNCFKSLQPREDFLKLMAEVQAANLPPTNATTVAGYSQAIERSPDDAKVWNDRGVVFAKWTGWYPARADFSEAIRLDPKLAGAWNNRGLVHLELGLLDRALADLSRAVELDPKSPKHWFLRGLVHEKLRHWDDAVADYSEALKLPAHGPQALISRGYAYAALSQWPKAAVDLGIATDPKALSEHAVVIACLRLLLDKPMGYPQLCEKIPAWLQEQKSPSVSGLTRPKLSHFVASRTCTLSKENPLDPARAVGWAEHACMQVRSPDHVHALGRAHYRAGAFDLAVRHSQESLRNAEPGWSGTMLNWLVLAMAQHRLGQPKEARQWLAKAVAWRDSLPRSRENTPIIPSDLSLVDWVEFHVLLAEAQTLLTGAKEENNRLARVAPRANLNLRRTSRTALLLAVRAGARLSSLARECREDAVGKN